MWPDKRCVTDVGTKRCARTGLVFVVKKQSAPMDRSVRVKTCYKAKESLPCLQYDGSTQDIAQSTLN